MAWFDLSDAEWRIIQPLLPNKPRGVPRADDRRVLSAIFFKLKDFRRVATRFDKLARNDLASVLLASTRI